MKFIPYTHNQGTLLPNYIEDWIPEGHLCQVVNTVVEQLNINYLEELYEEEGRPAYHPRVMLKILFYAYASGLRSSRKIAKHLETDIAYIYLAAHQTPDFHTIADFRRKHSQSLHSLFVQIVLLCYELGMVKLGHLALDGVRIKANASKKKSRKLGELEEALKEARQLISQVMEQAESIDQEEDKASTVNQEDLHKQIKDKQELINKLETAKEALKQLGVNWVNLTDPESTFQKTEYGLRPAYNGQCMVDEKDQVIVAEKVIDKSVDSKQLKPMVEQTKENLGVFEPKPEKLSADSGYYSGENLKFLEDQKIDGYIPSNLRSKEGSSDNRLPGGSFSKERFQYSKDEDTYRCPQGQTLVLSHTKIRAGTKHKDKRVLVYRGTTCKGCASRWLCVSKQNRTGMRGIEHDGYEDCRQRMKEKLDLEEGKDIYSRRSHIVEPVFGHMKQNLGYRQFLLRGLGGVQGEFSLMCIGHNIGKIWRFWRNCKN